MDDDIQFGDVEETGPETRLRPDENRHYAVAPYESPSEADLPVFIDLDVVRDIETHAQSDTTVELGGVLLGGQYLDENDRPFVVVTDSLRAQHYEATKGSFKFTHETWQQISRERDEFPEELQMVGWYHTHPDWGVFLSGMDMFICDNFFNRPLDLALVVDPCRGDRAFFQWTGEPHERIRRTDGFYVTASRFREAELNQYTFQLERATAMSHDPRQSGYGGGGYGAPIVNVTRDRNNEQAWQGPAVLGMLTLQFCLLALLAWKILDPIGPAKEEATKDEKAIAAAHEQIEKDQAALQLERNRLLGVQEGLEAARLALAAGVGEDGAPLYVKEFASLQADRERLRTQLDKSDLAYVAVKEQLKDANNALEISELNIKALKNTKAENVKEIAKLKAAAKEDKKEIAALKAKLGGDDKSGEGEKGPTLADITWTTWAIIVGGAVLAMGLAGVAAWVAHSGKDPELPPKNTEQSPSPPNNQEEPSQAKKPDDANRQEPRG